MKKSCLFTIALLSLASLVGCNTGGGGGGGGGGSDVKVTGITTNEAAFSIEVGESHDFDYKVAPDDASDKTVTFSVKSGEDYVDVSGSKVTGKAAGVASVEGVTKDGGFKVSYTVTVVPASQKFDFKADVAEFYGDNCPEDFDLPKFVCASEDADYELDDSWVEFAGLYFVYVDDASAEEFATYVSSLQAAGWVVESEEDGDYYLRFKESGACLNATYVPADGDDVAYAALGFFWEELPLDHWPAAEIDEEFTALGVKDRLPAFSGDAVSYEYFSGETFFGYSRYVHINVEEGSEAAAVATYKEDLLAAGFVEAGEDDDGDMHYISAGYELEVCPYDNTLYDGEGVIVDIYVLYTLEASIAGLLADSFFGEGASEYVEAGDDAVYLGQGTYGPGASFDSVFFNLQDEGAHVTLDDFLYTIGYIEAEEEGADPEAPIMSYILDAFAEEGEMFINASSSYAEADEIHNEGGEDYIRTDSYIAGIYGLVDISEEGEMVGVYLTIVEVDLLSFSRSDLIEMGDEGQSIIDAGIYFDSDDNCAVALASISVAYQLFSEE